MRALLAILMLVPGCFDEAPPVDDDEGIAADDDASDESSSDDASESSSSGGEPLSWRDAYGPCDVDAECPLIPGDDGEYGESPRCVQGTCTIRCADASGGGDMACPGYTLREPATPQSPRAIICQDGYCTIQFDPFGPGSACPEGMSPSDTVTVPDLDCVWEP